MKYIRNLVQDNNFPDPPQCGPRRKKIIANLLRFSESEDSVSMRGGPGGRGFGGPRGPPRFGGPGFGGPPGPPGGGTNS